MPRKSANQRQADSFVTQSVPRTPVIYEIVRRRGEEEMARPIVSLWWSGVAAGLSISFSLLAQTILYHHLPEAIWRPLVVDLGYPIGFIIVILARQQLFTENTITVVLPVMAEPTRANFAGLGRMWSVVLAANFAGTLAAALIASFTPVLTPGLHATMMEISRDAMAADWLHMFFLGAPAGFLIAAMVWLLPNAQASQFFVIGLMTYLIGVGGPFFMLDRGPL